MPEVATARPPARPGVELRTGPLRPLPEDAFYEPRKRYRAEKLLDHLDTLPTRTRLRAITK